MFTSIHGAYIQSRKDLSDPKYMSSKNEYTPRNVKRKFSTSSSSSSSSSGGNFRKYTKPNKFTKTNTKKRFTDKNQFPLTTMCTTKTIDQIWPDRYCCTLKNEARISFPNTGGAINALSIMGNGLHNPVSPVTAGATPLAASVAVNIYGLPNILAASGAFNSVGPYNNYRIHSSKITLKIMSDGANGNSFNFVLIPVTANLYANLGNVSTFTYTNMSEMPYAKVYSGSSQQINKAQIVWNAMSTHRQYALKYRAQMEDVEYTGTVGTNPANIWHWVFASFTNAAVTNQIDITLHIEYFTEFFNRNALAAGQG